MSSEAQLKHLDMVQAVITRMAHNSFLLKGWSVTLSAALLALSAQGTQPVFILLALLPTLMFWGLDAYFLRQERLFRKLYDAVRRPDNATTVNFSMNTTPHQTDVASWLRVLVSPTLGGFHGVMTVVILLVFAITTCLN